MVVCQSRPQVEVFRGNAEGLWVLDCFRAGEPVVLTRVDWEGAIATGLFGFLCKPRTPSPPWPLLIA
ncbi:MAG: hypothetical protein ACKO63_05070 [Nodosilinea sp.]